MVKICGVGVGLLPFFLWMTVAHAADRFWVGASNSLSEVWEDPANWSDMPQGPGGSAVPGTSDIAIFSLSGSTARMRSDVTVSGIFLANTWTGSVLQGTGILVVGRDGVRVGSGRLIGGTGNVTGSGSYTQTGGIVVASQARYAQSGSFLITDGGGTGIPKPSFTSTGTLVLGGDAQDVSAHPIYASITSLTMSGSSRVTLRSAIAATSSLEVGTGAVLTINGFVFSATGSSVAIRNYATITEGTGAIVHTASSFFITDSSYAETATVTAPTAASLTLTEADENIDGTAMDTLTVAMIVGDDIETVTLTETSNTSGVFQGGILTAQAPITVGNGRLDLPSGSATLTSSFTDAQDGLTTTDTATLAIPAVANTASSSEVSASSGGGGGARASAAISRGELPSKKPMTSEPRSQQPTQPPMQPVQPKPRMTISPALQIRICERVSKRFGGSGSMRDKVSKRLQKRFGFSCS